MAKAGTVERIRHGVYRIGGAPSVPSERLRAAWMMIEPGATAGERLREGSPAVVTHRSAAWLHGLGDVDADVMEFATSKRRQSRLPMFGTALRPMSRMRGHSRMGCRLRRC